MDFAAEEAKGLAYIPSMAVVVLIAAPLLTLAFMALGQAPLQLHIKSAALPGILAGIVWNVGNVRAPPTRILFRFCDPGIWLTQPITSMIMRHVDSL